MKKITFLLFTIFLITFKTAAQDSKFKFGVQGGLNYSSFRGYENYADNNPGFAYLFGASFQYQIKENLSLKVDINFERKSQITKFTTELIYSSPISIPEIYHVRINSYRNYVVLPIMIKYNFTRNKNFYINGGPFLGYLIKAGLKTSGINAPGINTDDTDNTKYYKSLDYGLSAGVGKEFKLNNNHQIYIELRENLGLANTSKNEGIYNAIIKTNSLNLIVGYTFN